MPRWPLVLAVCALLALPAGAHATTYYVGQSHPMANDANACTAQALPCLTIGGALAKPPTAGDDVVVIPDPAGTTDVYTEMIDVPAGVRLTGAGAGDGGTHVTSNGSTMALSDGASLQDIRVSTTADAHAVFSEGPATRVDRARLAAADSHAYGGPGQVRDTLLEGHGGAFSSEGDLLLVRVRVNITTTTGGRGIEVQDDKVTVLNSIVQGPANAQFGLLAFPGSAGSVATLEARGVTVTGFQTRARVVDDSTRATIGNSTLAGSSGADLMVGFGANVALTNVNRSPARTTNDGTGVIADANPIDVDPGLAPDGLLLPGSPLIDRGATGGPLAGHADDAFDILGRARCQGAAPDVGGNETIATPTGACAAAPPPPPGPPPPGPPDVTAPGIERASLANTVFAVGRAATPISAQRRRVKRGTTFRFRLSEAARVNIRIQRAAAGRRRGRRCVKPTRRLRRARRCTRWVSAGRTLTRNLGAGSQRVPFSGRIGRRALRPGRHRALLQAVDAAGNRSRTITLRFRIVRP